MAPKKQKYDAFKGCPDESDSESDTKHLAHLQEFLHGYELDRNRVNRKIADCTLKIGELEQSMVMKRTKKAMKRSEGKEKEVGEKTKYKNNDDDDEADKSDKGGKSAGSSGGTGINVVLSVS